MIFLARPKLQNRIARRERMFTLKFYSNRARVQLDKLVKPHPLVYCHGDDREHYSKRFANAPIDF